MFKVFYNNTIMPSPTGGCPADMLGALYFSQQPTEPGDAGTDSIAAHVAMPGLGGQTALYESFQSAGPSWSGRSGNVRFRFNADVLFGIITLNESEFPADADSSPLQVASKAAYAQIFAALESHDFPYVLRFWNYMADINGISHGLERYRQFNLGRQQAFEAKGRDVAGNVPAACALGTAGGPLTIAFLAGRTPSVAIENPRQVSAYDYPEQYGPRSPLFSRASVASVAGTRLLFLSGTASIVGHQTLHAGDVVAQTGETITNIAAVLAAANEKTSARCTVADLNYVVYIRDPAHFSAVSEALTQRLGPNLKASYVQADICRADLLVEIEGSAELQ
jgi:enamine deaminase RidA (YjgF/YER057c/UK114 family)